MYVLLGLYQVSVGKAYEHLIKSKGTLAKTFLADYVSRPFPTLRQGVELLDMLSLPRPVNLIQCISGVFPPPTNWPTI